MNYEEIRKNKIAKALEIAKKAHEGQVRRDGLPYITHPIAVSEMVGDEYIQYDKIVALLHDVVEGSEVTLEEIGRQFGKEVADAVEAITHRDDEDYYDYLMRVIRNDIARRVKIADLTHNISNNDNKHQKEKYELALRILKEREEKERRTDEKEFADSCYEWAEWDMQQHALRRDQNLFDDNLLKPVLIMGGGYGAGKTTGLKTLGKEILSQYALVIEGNCTSVKELKDSVELAKSAGRTAVYLYVERDPIEACKSIIGDVAAGGRVRISMERVVDSQSAREVCRQVPMLYDAEIRAGVFEAYIFNNQTMTFARLGPHKSVCAESGPWNSPTGRRLRVMARHTVEAFAEGMKKKFPHAQKPLSETMGADSETPQLERGLESSKAVLMKYINTYPIATTLLIWGLLFLTLFIIAKVFPISK